MNDEQLKAFKDKHGYGILHFPTVIGAAVLSYNLPGMSEEINFTPEAIAGIFLGKITTWNDPELAKANPGMKLPTDKIVRCPPVRQQRNHLLLDRLPVQGEPGMVHQSRQEHSCQLADRHRRQGQ